MYFLCTNNCVSRNRNKSGLALIVYSIKQVLEGTEQYHLFSSDLQIMTGLSFTWCAAFLCFHSWLSAFISNKMFR